MSASNVLRVNATEEQEAYREAVAEILRRVQSQHRVTLLEIAERIDVSLGTISNAANKKTDLCSTYLKRLGQAYGPHALDPYLALIGARAVPLDCANVIDILPLLMRAATKVAEARDPRSPGGVVEVHTEKLGYLPDFEALHRDLEALIVSIRGLAA